MKKDKDLKEDLYNITLAKNHSFELENLEKKQRIDKYRYNEEI